MSCKYRHWFTKYGWPGVRLQWCVRLGCQAPNPGWPRLAKLAAVGKGEIGRPSRRGAPLEYRP